MPSVQDVNGRQGTEEPTPAPSLAATAEYVTGPAGSGVGPGPLDPESSACFEHPPSVSSSASGSESRGNLAVITATFVQKGVLQGRLIDLDPRGQECPCPPPYVGSDGYSRPIQ